MPRNRMIGPVVLARACLGVVLLANLSAAAPYLLAPGRYLAGLELQGAGGEALVRALGVLFLMWNATYPPVILDPLGRRTLFGVIVVQQVIGLVGELWILAALPGGHPALAATGLRFVVFDGVGLLLLLVAFFATRASESR